MTKLTTPQKQALGHAARSCGIIRANRFSTTVLNNLKDAGLIERVMNYEYAITEAGAAAIGKSKDWSLIYAMICEYKLDNHFLRDCGKVILWGGKQWRVDDRLDYDYRRGTHEQEVDRIADHLKLAIELTHAELRAGLA